MTPIPSVLSLGEVLIDMIVSDGSPTRENAGEFTARPGGAPANVAVALGKADIVRRAVKLGVDFALTWSCYDPRPDGRPCGVCDSCVLRSKGFAEAGVVDPLAR